MASKARVAVSALFCSTLIIGAYDVRPAYAGDGAAVAAGIAGFAIGVMTGAAARSRAPAPRRSTSSRSSNRSSGTRSSSSSSSQAARSSADVVAVQKALAHFSYYDGTIDGLSGPQTRAAISALQTQQEWPVTGQLTDDQKRILLSNYADAQNGQTAPAAVDNQGQGRPALRDDQRPESGRWPRRRAWRRPDSFADSRDRLSCRRPAESSSAETPRRPARRHDGRPRRRTGSARTAPTGPRLPPRRPAACWRSPAGTWCPTSSATRVRPPCCGRPRPSRSCRASTSPGAGGVLAHRREHAGAPSRATDGGTRRDDRQDLCRVQDRGSRRGRRRRRRSPTSRSASVSATRTTRPTS